MPEMLLPFTSGDRARPNRHWEDRELDAWLMRNLQECDRYRARVVRWAQGVGLLLVLGVLLVLGMAL